MAFEIQLERRYVDDPPAEIQARRERVLAILRKYRHLLTPLPPSPKIEPPHAKEGSHD